MGKFDSRQKRNLIRIIISMVLFVALIVAEHTDAFGPFLYWAGLNGVDHHIIMLILYLIPYLIVGYDVVINCFVNIAHGQMFDETFLMTLATIGAFGCGELEEAVAVMLFYQVGEFFQSYAVGKSRGAIQELMSIAPDFANRISDDGSVEVIDPDDVEVGDILLVKPGEKIPVDAVVTQGEGYINTAALTGESMPLFVREGDNIISGCINGDNLIRIRAEKVYDDSTVAQILEMVENAATKKSKTEAFITRFARYYTPIVVIAGAALAVIPSLITGNWAMWILRACTFLVISCPCALVISVPLAFFGGIGAASRIGVLVKGSNYLEMMARLEVFVSDKTGTLTEGSFSVSDIRPAEGVDPDELIKLAASVEANSTHPIALSIVQACEDPIAQDIVDDVQNVAGKGISALVNGERIAAGNKAMMEAEAAIVPDDMSLFSGTIVHVAKDGKYIGSIVVSDAPKVGTKEAIHDIINENIRVVMLTGDSEAAAQTVGAELGISDVMAGLLPQDKVNAVEKMLNGISDARRYLAFAGDGINDAPVLRRADVGIAMGSLGSDAAIEAADIVIMDDDLSKIPSVIKIARKTLSISSSNIVIALTVKIACLILGALGIANMWVAVFADVGVAMICILNSMRMLVRSRE